MPRFLDTNILLRYFTGSPPEQAAGARWLLRRVECGEERVATSVMVLFETVFTLQRTYRVPRSEIQQMVADVLSLPGIMLAGKRLYLRALALYSETPGLSFTDAYNVVAMQEQGITEIYSFDTDFDKFDGVERVEPHEGGDTPG